MILAAAAHAQGVTWPDVAMAAVIGVAIIGFYWAIFKYSR